MTCLGGGRERELCLWCTLGDHREQRLFFLNLNYFAFSPLFFRISLCIETPDLNWMISWACCNKKFKIKFTLLNFDRKKDGTVDEELVVTSQHFWQEQHPVVWPWVITPLLDREDVVIEVKVDHHTALILCLFVDIPLTHVRWPGAIGTFEACSQSGRGRCGLNSAAWTFYLNVIFSGSLLCCNSVQWLEEK